MLRFRPFSATKALAEGRLTTIREFTRADVDRWLEWPRHDDPLFYVFNPPAMSPRQRDSYWISKRQAAESRQYAVDDLTGALVGRISLREIDWYSRCGVLGISFRRDRLSQGLGTDAMKAFLGYYFGPLGMEALFLDVAAHNERARRCYERCGFHRIGEHWGEAGPDLAGIFRDPRQAPLRPFFRWEHGLVRPLLYDMVLRRSDYERSAIKPQRRAREQERSDDGIAFGRDGGKEAGACNQESTVSQRVPGETRKQAKE
jgi:diamine N-acetyltransferase